MPYLRGCCGVVAVLVLIGKVVRLCRFCRVHLLHLGERFAHPPEGHRHFIRCALRLTAGLYQTVKVIISISVVKSTTEFRFVVIVIVITIGLCRVYGIGDAENIIHQVVLILVLHDGIPRRGERHLLQTLALLVVSVAAFRAVAELGVNGVSVFIVTYLFDKGFVFAEFVARKTFHLPRRIVVISRVIQLIPS